MESTVDNAEVLDTPALLRIASDTGYELSARMLETFRADGLIPRPTRAGYAARAPRWVHPVGSDRQLVALLRHRERTKDVNVLRILLWLEGYAVPTASARMAVTDGVQAMLKLVEAEITARAARPDVDSRDEAIRQLAVGVASKRGPRAIPRHGRVKAEDRSRSVELLLRAFGLGENIGVTEEQAGTVERTLGLAPKGRQHQVDGAGPWLTGPATTLFDAADVVALPRALQSVATATDAELELARDLVRVLHQALPVVARLMALMFEDDNFAGMGGFARLGDDPGIVMILIPVVVGMLRAGWADNIQAVANALLEMPDFAANIQEILDLPAGLLQQRLSSQPQAQRAMQRMIAAALDGTLPSMPTSRS